MQPRFSEPSRTARFRAYQTVTAKNQYGSAIKTVRNPRQLKKPRTIPIQYSTVPVYFVQFGLVQDPVQVKQYSHRRGKRVFLVSWDSIRCGTYCAILVNDQYRSQYWFTDPCMQMYSLFHSCRVVTCIGVRICHSTTLTKQQLTHDFLFP